MEDKNAKKSLFFSKDFSKTRHSINILAACFRRAQPKEDAHSFQYSQVSDDDDVVLRVVVLVVVVTEHRADEWGCRDSLASQRGVYALIRVVFSRASHS